MSVPLHEGDVDAVRAFLTLNAPHLAPPGTVTLQDGCLLVRTPPGADHQEQLRGLLRRAGYAVQTEKDVLRVVSRLAGHTVVDPADRPPQQVRNGWLRIGRGHDTTGDPVTDMAVRLHRLRRLDQLPDTELLEDPDTTDDPDVVRLRERLRRREHRARLKERDRARRAQRRQERRRERQRARDERYRSRAERAQERSRLRADRLRERQERQKEREMAKFTRWQSRVEAAGERQLERQQMANTPEYRAALARRLQLGAVLVGAAAIIPLGAFSTASVAKFMVEFASADSVVAYAVEPAIIMMVVGVNIAKYLLARLGGTLPWQVVVLEYLALSASVVMAGTGAGAGAVVAPVGVVVVSVVVSAVLSAARRLDPSKEVPDRPRARGHLAQQVDEYLRQRRGTSGTDGVDQGGTSGVVAGQPVGTGSGPFEVPSGTGGRVTGSSTVPGTWGEPGAGTPGDRAVGTPGDRAVGTPGDWKGTVERGDRGTRGPSRGTSGTGVGTSGTGSSAAVVRSLDGRSGGTPRTGGGTSPVTPQGSSDRAEMARSKIADAAQELIDDGRDVTESAVRRLTGQKLSTVRNHWDVAERIVEESRAGAR